MLDYIYSFLPDLSEFGFTIGNLDARFYIFVALFMGMLLLFEGMRQLSSRKESREEAKSRRMRLVNKGVAPEKIVEILKPNEKLTLAEQIPGLGFLLRALKQSGSKMGADRFVIYCLISGGCVLFLFMSIVGFFNALLLAVITCGILPLVVLQGKRARRMDAMSRQLPDALELMARGLRVGHPLNTTLHSVATEMSDPIGTEFGLIVDQVSYGDDLPDAVKEMSQRVDTEDMHYFAVSVGIQHGTGGDLATILDTLAKVVRDRAAMRKKIKAISAESRMSAIFLSCIPLFIFAFMSLLVPNYFGDVKDDPMYLPMLGTIGAFIAINAFLLHKLVRFRF